MMVPVWWLWCGEASLVMVRLALVLSALVGTADGCTGWLCWWWVTGCGYALVGVVEGVVVPHSGSPRGQPRRGNRTLKATCIRHTNHVMNSAIYSARNSLSILVDTYTS